MVRNEILSSFFGFSLGDLPSEIQTSSYYVSFFEERDLEESPFAFPTFSWPSSFPHFPGLLTLVSASSSKPKDHQSLPFRAASLLANALLKTLRDAARAPVLLFPTVLVFNSYFASWTRATWLGELSRRNESAPICRPPLSPKPPPRVCWWWWRWD